ncbi:replication factor-a protein [Crucibulum laeve]|uniref:Replication protein A subunit n=1 Tax=Crucibulum laeve TaxID=68775 RepID=A0A5C3MMS7_9AGAR|nr:replication factor-a protein [Crucibulum laeve]
MSFQLTAGSATSLHNSSPDDEDIFDAPHTVQFLSIKKVNSSANSVDRYRIIMSDGEHFVQAMLATQLNGMVQDNTIGKNTVAVIEKLTCNYVQEKRLIIILALRVLGTPDEKIGDPKQIVDTANPVRATPSTSNSNVTKPAVASTSTAPSFNPPQQQNPVQTRPAPAGKARPGSIFPIEGLSPYQNNWTIKARVTQKSDIKTWSNQRGEGKLFNVTLMDESGEIRGTAFNLVVDELYPKLEEGKVYYISKARVNLAKKKFSNLTNDYELSFERNTEIEECHETTNVPMIKYNFVQLSQLQDLPKDSTCDVIGVVKDVSPMSEIVSKQTNRAIPKRELTLVDKSGYSVRLTLWGKQAEQYNTEDSPIIAFKGVKVGDFGGRSLSMFSSSTMQINPEIDECFALRGWYDSAGADQSFQAHSNSAMGGSTMSFNRSEIRSLDDVKQSQLGTPDKAEYFSTRATIMHIKADSISYPACPTANCNKKVVQDNSGGWRCEKCDQSFAAPEHRYIMSLAVADYSGQAWLQGFNDVGLAVFGMTANELIEIKERDESKYNVILHKANCNTYNFSCRAKQDTYNEQTRVRYGISRIYPLDYKEEALALRDLLHSPWAR